MKYAIPDSAINAMAKYPTNEIRFRMLIASFFGNGRAQHSPVSIGYYSGIIAIGQQAFWEHDIPSVARLIGVVSLKFLPASSELN